MKAFRSHPVLVGFSFITIWQTLLIFQGLDLADTGFHLTSYVYILKAPYSVQYSMSFWLSDVCGYLWMSIWPLGGLLWARIGWVAIITTSIIIYSQILKTELGSQKTILGLIVTTVFILQGGPECLNYDILTILGYSVTIAFLLGGLHQNRNIYLLVAGIFLGISIFLKLTNLSALLFVLTIPFWVFWQKKSILYFVKTSLIFLLGVAVGAFFIWFLIWKFGHNELFLDNLSFISNMTKDSEASHGIVPLITSYLSGYLNAIIILTVSLAAIFVFIKLSGRFEQLASKKSKLVLYFITAIGTAACMIIFEKPFWSKIRYLFIGLMLFEAIFNIFKKTIPDKKRLFYFIGLLLLLVAPLGSDSGLEKSVFGMWILGPLVLTDLNWINYFKQLKTITTQHQAKITQTSILILVLTTSVFYAWQNTYFDSGSRAKKTFAIEHPKMRCIYTSQERAEVINELINKGFPKIQKHKYLLSFIETPMINYLAGKEPFISSSWPKLYYSPQSFEKKLNEAIAKREEFPIIIRQKQNTGSHEWPKGQAESDYLSYPDDLSKWPEHGKILNHFIEKYNYEVIWENEMFQVLLLKGSIEKGCLNKTALLF